MNLSTRSALFVPANRPERIDKACASGADAVIIDLEDAVAPAQKSQARNRLQSILKQIPTGDSSLWIRINPASTPWFADDLAMCADVPTVDGVMLAKTEHAAVVQRAASVGKPLWPLLESARGFLNLAEIAAAPKVERLAFGALDAALDLNLDNGDGAETVLDQLRTQLVLHSRAARLAPPLETVVPEFRDTGPVQHMAQRAHQMGFGGMLCIHPAQLAAIHEAFASSAGRLDWARRILMASERESLPFQLDGEMVDEPVIERARRLLNDNDEYRRP